MPSQRIIALFKTADRWDVLYWLDVPAARQRFYASTGHRSAWIDASQAENDALASGAVVERPDVITRPPGTNMATLQALAEARWQEEQNKVNAHNPWARYGTRWDGVSWTLTTVD